MSGSSVSKRERPLSPHLQVYRLPYNAKMSISGRAVGIGLAGSVCVLFLWFSAIVWNPSLYELTMNFLDHALIKYVLLLWAFAVFFYLGNGVRHLLWDMSIGVNVKFGVMTGNIVLALAALLTIWLWIRASDPPAENFSWDLASGIEETAYDSE